MTTKDGKIKSTTENELFRLYIQRGYDDLMSFDDYKFRMKLAGVKLEVEHGK